MTHLNLHVSHSMLASRQFDEELFCNESKVVVNAKMQRA